MKAKEGFNLKKICDEYVILAEGKTNIDFCNIINMNESSAYLWKKLSDSHKEFTIEDMANLLVEEYEVDKKTALTDAAKLAEQWVKAGIVTQ